MAYSEKLVVRVRKIFHDQNVVINEKKMVDGLTFMVNDKMCTGILNNDLMVRIAPEDYDPALLKPCCRPMDFTGKPLKGFVLVDPDALSSDDNLFWWIKLAFNTRAKSYKKAAKK